MVVAGVSRQALALSAPDGLGPLAYSADLSCSKERPPISRGGVGVRRVGGLVLDQGALGLMPADAAQTRQATLDVLVEVSLNRAPGDVGVGRNVVVVQSVALQPEDFHFALDAGVRVKISIVGQGPPIV